MLQRPWSTPDALARRLDGLVWRCKMLALTSRYTVELGNLRHECQARAQTRTNRIEDLWIVAACTDVIRRLKGMATEFGSSLNGREDPTDDLDALERTLDRLASELRNLSSRQEALRLDGRILDLLHQLERIRESAESTGQPTSPN